MSIFGGPRTSVNMYGLKQGNSGNNDSIDFTNQLLNLFDIVETIEEAIVDIIPGDRFGITPSVGFKNISVTGGYSQLLSRRLYYQNGFPTLPTGICDCRILRRLYEEHPLLRLYSFESAEPACCT